MVEERRRKEREMAFYIVWLASSRPPQLFTATK
jgi:hypothetical protein